MNTIRFFAFLIALLCLLPGKRCFAQAQASTRDFRAVAFFTAKNDLAHISFVREANRWFMHKASIHNFSYDTTSNWKQLNEKFLSQYDVVIFLDTRPQAQEQRLSFRNFVDGGGAWLGFHFSAFTLGNSAYPNDWPWYSEDFIGSGQYKSNTWRPTAETLHVDLPSHPVCKGIPATFLSAPNEWYCWERDLRQNNDIEIILSLDRETFPVGTGPKAHEIWHSGYFPVAWSNKKYRMIYLNMGHNDMDYDGGTNRELSSTFSSETQSLFILQSLLWLGRR